MSTALVTTLKEAVLDTSLVKLNEVRLWYSTSHTFGSMKIRPKTGTSVTLTINSDNYFFTNSTLTSNLGKTLEVTQNQIVYLLPKDTTITLSGKNNVEYLAVHNVSGYIDFDFSSLLGFTNLKELAVSITDFSNVKYLSQLEGLSVYVPTFKGSLAELHALNLVDFRNFSTPAVTGSLSDLAHMTNMQILVLQNSEVTGEVSSLVSMPLTFLSLANSKKIGGTLVSFAGMTDLTNLNLKNTAITGNISSLSNLTNLALLDVSDTAVIGDTSSLAGLTNLRTFNYTNSNVTGTWPLV